MAGVSTGVSLLTTPYQAVKRTGSLGFTGTTSGYSASKVNDTASAKMDFDAEGYIYIYDQDFVDLVPAGSARWHSASNYVLYPYFEVRFTLQSGTLTGLTQGWNPVSATQYSSFLYLARTTNGVSTGTALVEIREIGNPSNYISTSFTLTVTRS
jgi:hypothetical protein